jgi:RNA polymerase sigma factor (sigma-70 family)
LISGKTEPDLRVRRTILQGTIELLTEVSGMANAQANIVLRHIRDLAGVADLAALSDRQLLQRFTTERDESAFASLVRRHGSLVAGVCRRVLGNFHDAEDAFQAVFLVLARKASAIRKSESVGGWLYRVAYRVAMQARVRALSRQRHEQQAGKCPVVDPLAEVTGRELVSILDEELQRLPERYQVPLVLCHLEGQTRDEAAQRLGWSLGTFKRRLELAREVLRGRLARRGLTLAAVLSAAAGVVPSVCVASTVRVVFKAADFPATVSESVATLADGALKALLPTSRVVAVCGLLLASVLALGLGVFTRPAGARLQIGDPATLTLPLPDVKEPAKNDPVKPAAENDLSVKGRVLDPDGKPVAKAEVALLAWPRAPLRGDAELTSPRIVAQGKADAKGRFHLTTPGRSRSAFWNPSVVARAPGYALGQERLDPDPDNKQAEVEVRLNPEQAVRGRLVDLQGQPVAGVKLRVITVNGRLSPKKDLHAVVIKPPKGPTAWPGPVTSDAKGRFVLHGLRSDWEITLRVSAKHLAQQDLDLKAQDKGKAEEVTLALAPVRVVEGTITYEDTGKPVPNARVLVVALEQNEFGGTTSRESDWQTDAKGRFRAVPDFGSRYSVIASAPQGEPYLLLSKTFSWPKGAVVKHEVHLKLPRGVLVRGIVTEAGSGKPITGAHIYFEPLPDKNPFYRSDVRTQSRWHANLVSGPDGKFAITVLPGPGHLLVNGPTLDYLHAEILTTKLYGSTVRPEQRNYADAIVKLNSKPGDGPQELTIKLRRGVTVSGQLLRPDGKPVAKAQLLCQSYLPYGTYLNNVRPLLVGKGKFELPGYDPDHPLPVYFLDAENQLGAMVKFSGKDVDGKAVVKLQPCGSATARFLDAKGKPLANLDTHLDLALNDGISFFDSLNSDKVITDVAFLSSLDPKRYEDLRTDAEGRVTWPTLIPGARIMLIVKTPQGRYVDVRKDFTVEAGKTLDLKDITVQTPQ